MKTTHEIVNYLVRHFSKDIEQPEKIADLTAQTADFLAERLKEDTPHGTLWDDFRAAPLETAAALTGTLEALFEAQPAVRKRVDGFMRQITVMEVQNAPRSARENPAQSLKARAGQQPPLDEEGRQILARGRQEKNPPAYLYGNERAGFENVEDKPAPNAFMVGKNAQVIHIPDEEMKFPFMFMHLGRVTEAAEDLNPPEKELIQHNLQRIRCQLEGDCPFDEEAMAAAFEAIWEKAPAYANTLIKSLQDHIEALPVEAQVFIMQLHTPLI